jgi:SAM-dependent methyltransferase
MAPSKTITEDKLPMMAGETDDTSTLSYYISTGDYIRQRINPKPGDDFYLHLSDLLIGIKQLIPKKSARVLDYGCGGSPYRGLFGCEAYDRADLQGGDDLDFEYGEDAELPTQLNGYYDCVVSSQVLEHVASPADYLANCYRILQPKGWLILSTHGTFEDHGCPIDYWRWTASGLVKIVEKAGFKVCSAKKLTTGPRAAMFILERELYRMKFFGSGPYGGLLHYGARVVRRVGARRRHLVCDRSFPQHRSVAASEPGHDIYVAVAIAAQR